MDGRRYHAQIGDSLATLFDFFDHSADDLATAGAEYQAEFVKQVCPVELAVCFKISGRKSAINVIHVGAPCACDE